MLTRRNFLKQTGGLAITSTVASSLLLNSCTKNDRVNVAFIGMGGRGQGLLKSFMLVPKTQIIAICDPFTQRREDRSNWVNEVYAKRNKKVKYKSCQAYNNYEDVLDRDDVDAVVIATQDHWHVPIAYAAIKAGKDVYVEKPLGISIADGIRLRELATKKKTVVQYGTQQRSSKNFHLAAEIAATGVIGKIKNIDAWCDGGIHLSGIDKPMPIPQGFDYDRWLGPAPTSPYTKDRCTNYGSWFIYDYALGFIAGWGAHPLDIAQWGNQSDNTSPVSYEGDGAFFESTNLFDTINKWDIHCKYANGVNMHFFSSDKMEDYVAGKRKNIVNHGTTFWGENGWVSVDRNGIEVSEPQLLEVQHNKEFQLYKSENHYKNFIDCVVSRKKTISPLEAAVRSDTISNLCNVLIRSGAGKLEWNSEKELIINPTSAMESHMSRKSRPEYDIMK